MCSCLKENFMDAPQYKSIEYQFRDQRLYEDYYAAFFNRMGILGLAGGLLPGLPDLCI